jgi:hypothetical protein
VAELKDDETRLAKFGALSSERKAAIRAAQQEELDAAKKERKRPTSSRVLDAMSEAFGSAKGAEATRQRAADDTARRERRFQEAQRAAGMSDEDMDKQSRLYGDTKAHKLKKGGKATASSRADGIAQRGKTRGKLV